MRSASPPLSAAPRTAGSFAALMDRSEEHTSELQSQSKLVCRLPLEKKNRDALWRPMVVSARAGIAKWLLYLLVDTFAGVRQYSHGDYVAMLTGFLGWPVAGLALHPL